jgi:hypothetical protein
VGATFIVLKKLSMKSITFSSRGILMAAFMLSSVYEMNAQGKFNVGFRPSFSFPTVDLGTSKLNRGGGFEATFSYRFVPSFAGYAGWGWSTFKPKESATVAHFEETGFRFGIQFIQPFGAESKLKVLLSAGGVVNHIETENNEGDIMDDSAHGMGWEVDAGLSIPLSDSWQIVPGIRYHALPSEISYDGNVESVDLNYLSIGVTVSWTLKEE